MRGKKERQDGNLCITTPFGIDDTILPGKVHP